MTRTMSPAACSEADPVARRRAHLPADIILTAREIKHYRQWQLQTQLCATSVKFDRLPSALEYNAFKAWRLEQKRAADTCLPDPFRWSEELAAHISPTSETAPSLGSRTFTCDPILHPTKAAKPTRDDECLPCVISAHLTYMKLLTSILDNAGGPALPPMNATPEHELAFEAWYCGKLDLVKTVCMIQEHEDRTDSASEALAMYWNTIENSTAPPGDYDCDCNDFGGVIKRRDSANMKKVGFADDTNFNEGRSQAYFRKEGPRSVSAGRRDAPQSEDESRNTNDDENETRVAGEAVKGAEEEEEGTKTNDTQVHDDPDMEYTIIFEADSESDLDDEDEDESEDESEDDDDDEDDAEWDTPVSDADCDDLDASYIVFGD